MCKNKNELRKIYTASFKLDVVRFAKKNGLLATSCDVSIQPTPRHWKNRKDKLKAARRDLNFGGPKIGCFPTVEDKVMEWVEEKEKRSHNM